MREELVGYVLGALESHERELVERELEANEQLRREVAVLERRLTFLKEADGEETPPRGLAARTCQAVAMHATSGAATTPISVRSEAQGGRRGTRLSPDLRPELRRPRWSIVDWSVAIGVVAATILLFMPVLLNSRELARISACQDKLREMGTALISYSEIDANHSFPAVPSDGELAFAGMYAPILVERGLVRDPSLLVCPSSEFASRHHGMRLLRVEDLRRMSLAELESLRPWVGGSYGYNLGVLDGGRHVPIRNRGRTHFALMSDTPNLTLADHKSPNHLGRGQNLLYEDGHVAFTVGFPQGCVDNPFCNRRGRVEVGLDPDDAVVGASSAKPFIRQIDLPR